MVKKHNYFGDRSKPLICEDLIQDRQSYAIKCVEDLIL